MTMTAVRRRCVHGHVGVHHDKPTRWARDGEDLEQRRIGRGERPIRAFSSNRGILKDGNTLMLTLTRFENGKPDRAVVDIC